MQSSEALFEPLAKRFDAFAVNTSSPVIGPDALPGNLQVLPLVHLVDQ
jgi:ethanolamine ammonia-lyase large subunit